MKKIFFSWQSDNKPVRNKVQSALQKAVNAIGKEIEEADRPELDSDTKGRYSSEDIMATIFEKIESASVFIADATPIAKSGDKLIPNPNVMAEIGYALKVMRPNTKLFLFASDDPKAPDKMPFDIRGKKLFPIDMSLTPKQISEELIPVLKWMLEQAGTLNPAEEYPLIYAEGGTWTKWADGSSVAFSIRNSSDNEYMIEAIELEGHSAEPFRALKPNSTTQGITINGPTQVFESKDPILKMTITRNGKQYRLEQRFITTPRVDGKFNFTRFIETSVPVLY